MAILINTENLLSEIEYSDALSDDVIADLINANILVYRDMGIYLLAYTKDESNKLNTHASLSVNHLIYGDVIMLSGSELDDLSVATKSKENSRFTQNELNDGIKLIVADAVFTATTIAKLGKLDLGFDFDDGFNKIQQPFQKKVLFFDPKKLKDDEVQQNKQFVDSMFNVMIDELTKNNSKDGIEIFADDQIIIKIRPDNLVQTLNAFKTFYIEREEYEKCSSLQNFLDTLDKT